MPTGMGAPEAEAGPGMTGNTATETMAFTNFNRKMVKTGRWAVLGKGSEVLWVRIAHDWAPMQDMEILDCISNAVQGDEFCISQTSKPCISATVLYGHHDGVQPWS